MTTLMPFILDAVKSYATLGEICDAMRDTFGTYEEVAITCSPCQKKRFAY